MTRVLRYLALFGGLVLLVWGLKSTLFAADPIPVTTVAVAKGRVEHSVTNTRAGTVRAGRRARLSPEIGGRVVELPFREGDRVAQGEVLLRMASDVPAAQLEVTQRELTAARARAEEACLAADQAERELARNQGLAEQGIVSTDVQDRLQSAAEARRAGCAAARGALEAARAAVGLARADVDRTRVVAPFDAVVADLAVEVGEWATPSPAAMPVPPVIDLIDPSSIYVSAPMDEVDSALLEVGQEVRVTADSYPGETFRGEIRRVAPYVLDLEQQNRTVEVEVELLDEGPKRQLLPGTSADIEVLLEWRENALRLPTSVVIEGRRVLLLEEDRLVSRPVVTGLKNWDFTEIVEGVQEGDRVVDSLDRPEVEDGALAVEEANSEATPAP